MSAFPLKDHILNCLMFTFISLFLLKAFLSSTCSFSFSLSVGWQQLHCQGECLLSAALSPWHWCPVVETKDPVIKSLWSPGGIRPISFNIMDFGVHSNAWCAVRVVLVILGEKLEFY